MNVWVQCIILAFSFKKESIFTDTIHYSLQMDVRHVCHINLSNTIFCDSLFDKSLSFFAHASFVQSINNEYNDSLLCLNISMYTTHSFSASSKMWTEVFSPSKALIMNFDTHLQFGYKFCGSDKSTKSGRVPHPMKFCCFSTAELQ